MRGPASPDAQIEGSWEFCPFQIGHDPIVAEMCCDLGSLGEVIHRRKGDPLQGFELN